MHEILAKPLSPSRASQFHNCELQYRYRNIDGLPERPGEAAFKGTLVHAVLEEMFGLAPVDRTADNVKALLPATLDRLLDEDENYGYAIDPALAWPDDDPIPDDAAVDRLLTSAAVLVDNYFSREDPSRLEPTALEHHVEAELDGGVRIHGIIDRLEIKEGIGARISDYKTGKAPQPQYQSSYWFQMRFYALILWKTTGEIPKKLQLLFLGNSHVLEESPTEADLRDTEQKILDTSAAIRAAIISGTFQPRTSKLCDYCAHQRLCPAKGGTMLPLPYDPAGIAQS